MKIPPLGRAEIMKSATVTPMLSTQWYLKCRCVPRPLGVKSAVNLLRGYDSR